MSEQPGRVRFIERGEPARTPAEARQRRSTAMLVFGGVALVWALLLGIAGGSPVAVLLGLLGVGLLVGGLVIRN
jgi:hypothetical protein